MRLKKLARGQYVFTLDGEPYLLDDVFGDGIPMVFTSRAQAVQAARDKGIRVSPSGVCSPFKEWVEF
jgi:hypothetical protein